MKSPLWLITPALLALQAGQAAVINFDGVPSGTAVNSFAPAGVQFFGAVLLPDVDSFGDPIPGSDKWRIDVSAPDVLAENPSNYGYGTAPSPDNALNSLWSPTLLKFAQPTPLGSFSVTLDNSTYGQLQRVDLLFLDKDGNVLRSLTLDQTVPGLTVSTGPLLSDVADIVLPVGAFYDNLSYTPVPESNGLLLVGSGLLVGGLALRRYRGARS